MIHEILDYLLIRSFLINNTEEEIIKVVTDEESFSYLLDNIYKLMQEENFVFTSPILYDRVQGFITKYRFDYIKNKEYCEKMNYIIGRLHDYTLMSPNRKKNIMNNWVEEESKVRDLPKCYQTIQNLHTLVSLDMAYLKGMVSIGEPFEVHNVVEYASVINIIMNKFPDCFNEDHLFLEVARSNLEHLKRIPFLRFRDLKMLKNTINKLNKNYTISDDVEVEIDYSLKKIKK